MRLTATIPPLLTGGGDGGTRAAFTGWFRGRRRHTRAVTLPRSVSGPAEPAPSVVGARRPVRPLAPEHRGTATLGEPGGQGRPTHPYRSREPAVLVVHLQWAENSWVELAGPSGEGGRPRQILTHGSVLRRTIVPLEPDGDVRVSLLMHTRGTWRTWFHSPGDIPVLTDELASRGCYIVRPPRRPGDASCHPARRYGVHPARPPPGPLPRDPALRRHRGVHGIGHHAEAGRPAVHPVTRHMAHQGGVRKLL